MADQQRLWSVSQPRVRDMSLWPPRLCVAADDDDEDSLKQTKTVLHYKQNKLTRITTHKVTRTSLLTECCWFAVRFQDHAAAALKSSLRFPSAIATSVHNTTDSQCLVHSRAVMLTKQ